MKQSVYKNFRWDTYNISDGAVRATEQRRTNRKQHNHTTKSASRIFVGVFVIGSITSTKYHTNTKKFVHVCRWLQGEWRTPGGGALPREIQLLVVYLLPPQDCLV